jgi:hypothetical protein
MRRNAVHLEKKCEAAKKPHQLTTQYIFHNKLIVYTTSQRKQIIIFRTQKIYLNTCKG